MCNVFRVLIYLFLLLSDEERRFQERKGRRFQERTGHGSRRDQEARNEERETGKEQEKDDEVKEEVMSPVPRRPRATIRTDDMTHRPVNDNEMNLVEGSTRVKSP